MSGSALQDEPPHEMTLRERIAQLFFVRIGSNLPPVRTVEDDIERVARLLENCPLGGLLLFNGGSDTKGTLDRLQAISRVPLLVGADIERGVGQQVKGYTLFPHAMAFGALPETDDNSAIAAFSKVLAREAHEAGIHITFGPVADVNTNPRNPIIATRAFGEEPGRVANLVAAYVKNVQSLGIRATAKHFPGHGHTETDSHATLPIVTRSREELEMCELIPFQAAIDAGCTLVMTAHVAYPALDTSGKPATLSPIILQQLLRDQMGFGGAVCSDSLLMAGVRDRFDSEGEMALAVLNAGVDLLLDVADPPGAVDFLCQCVAEGRLSEARVDEALRRLWTLKRLPFQQVSGEARDRSRHERVARAAVKVLYDTGSAALPFQTDVPLTAILLKPFETALDPPEQPLAPALRKRFGEVRYVQLGPNADDAAYDHAGQLAAEAQQLLVAVIVRPAAWHEFGLRAKQSDFVRQFARGRRAVIASLGVPYVLDDYPGAAVRICTYSDVPVSQQALAEYLIT